MSIFQNTLNMQKKAASKKDWHKADIIAKVHKTGTSLRRMSRKLGLAHTALNNALHYPCPRYERIIAQHLNTTPQAIWPSRYKEDGTPRSGRGERGIGRHVKFNASAENDNVNNVDTREVA